MKPWFPLFALVYGLLIPAVLASPLEVRDGQFMREGKVYRGIGMNYYDAFLLALPVPEPGVTPVKAFGEGFAFLAAQKVPFVRFAACGFFPSQMKLYEDNPREYFKLLDEVVAEAEKHNLGLIPALFWSYFCVPDLVGEPISAWGDAKSKTRAFMRRYTREVVQRYRNSPAIWAWEFGNEFLNEADLPGPQNSAAWIVPSMKTAAKRTDKDKLTSEAAIAAYRDFQAVVRELDPKRPVLTGDASPRVSAWNLSRGQGWTPDTREQWMQALARANPTDTINLHFYHPRATRSGYGGYGISGASLRQILEATQAVSKANGKPTWLGEFGPGGGEMDVAERRRQVEEFLQLIEELDIPLSAYWVFNSPNPDLVVWNAAPDNENAFVFDLIRRANERLSNR